MHYSFLPPFSLSCHGSSKFRGLNRICVTPGYLGFGFQLYIFSAAGSLHTNSSFRLHFPFCCLLFFHWCEPLIASIVFLKTNLQAWNAVISYKRLTVKGRHYPHTGENRRWNERVSLYLPGWRLEFFPSGDILYMYHECWMLNVLNLIRWAIIPCNICICNLCEPFTWLNNNCRQPKYTKKAWTVFSYPRQFLHYNSVIPELLLNSRKILTSYWLDRYIRFEEH